MYMCVHKHKLFVKGTYLSELGVYYETPLTRCFPVCEVYNQRITITLCYGL